MEKDLSNFKIYLASLLMLLSIGVFSQNAELIIPKGHTSPISFLDVHQKNLWVASSQGDNSITIWNYDAEKEIRHFDFHESSISALKFHPKFNFLVSADVDGRIIINDVSRSSKRSDFIVHKAKINQIQFNTDYEYFITCSDDSTVKVIDFNNLKVVREYKLDFIPKSILVISKDIIYVGGSSGYIALLKPDVKIKTLVGPFEGTITDMIYSKSDSSLVAVSAVGNIYKISTKDYSTLITVKESIKVKKAISIDNERFILVGRGAREMNVKSLIDLSTDTLVLKNLILKKNLDPYDIAHQTVTSIEDSSLIIIPDYDYSFLVYDLEKGTIKKQFSGLTEKLKKLDIHPNGFFLAMASPQNGVRIFDLREREYPKSINDDKEVYSVSFSPLGDRIMVSAIDSLKLYSFPDLEFVNSFSIKGEYPNGLSGFISQDLFIKKDQKEGLSILNINTGKYEVLKLEEAFQFKINTKGDLLAVRSGFKRINLYSMPDLKKIKTIKTYPIQDFDFHGNKDQILCLDKVDNRKIYQYDLKGKLNGIISIGVENGINTIEALDNSNTFFGWNTSTSKGTGKNNLELYLISSNDGKSLGTYKGANSVINNVKYYENENLILASSDDGSIKVWQINEADSSKLDFPASIIPLNGLEYVCLMDNGVFDASRQAFEGMHYVQGKEYITLDQLKEEYYEPHLISKVFGFNEEPIKTRSAIGELELYPEIKLQHPNTNGGVLGIDYKERNGGVGEIFVWINGKMATTIDLKESKFEHLKYEIAGHPYLRNDEINTIGVSATNFKGNLISQKSSLRYIWNEGEVEDKPNFYAVIIGVSDYSGNKLDLEFSSKDANDISEALKKGAHNYFGAKNVNIHTLSSLDPDNRPTKTNVQNSILNVSKKIKSNDIFLFYFAGHGMQGQGQDQKFYLLTEEASKLKTLRFLDSDEYSISDQELAKWLGEISSHNMIMILDACHSGSLISNINSSNQLGSKEVKALEKLMDETGMYILAGSESDNVSYETSLYGQGLLTYSLLFGMKGEGLREGEYLDVDQLFRFVASNVPNLAKRIGGIQRPEVKLPAHAKKIEIGKYGEEDKKKIALVAPRPILLASSFQDDDLYLDILNLSSALDTQIKNTCKSEDKDIIFLHANDYSGAYEIKGRYWRNSGVYTINLRVFKGLNLVSESTFSDRELDILINQMTEFSLNEIQKDFVDSN